MYKRLLIPFLLVGQLMVLPGPVWGTNQSQPDYAREKRWAEEITPAILVGEAIYLKQQNGHAFLGILAEHENGDTAVVVAHGMGLHPDWGLIGVLRQRLYDFGYTTLSIQMPVLDAQADFDDYPAIFPDAVRRLRIAVKFLKQKGYKNIVLVSHSNGSRMSRIFMTSHPKAVTAWVAISLTREETFAGVKVPVFDVYGQYDLPHVLSAVRKRRVSFRWNPRSRQQRIAGAEHFFVGQEEPLIRAIRRYLDELR